MDEYDKLAREFPKSIEVYPRDASNANKRVIEYLETSEKK